MTAPTLGIGWPKVNLRQLRKLRGRLLFTSSKKISLLIPREATTAFLPKLSNNAHVGKGSRFARVSALEINSLQVTARRL
jgi:hypothetical protein